MTQIPDWVLDKIARYHRVIGPALDCGADACVWETKTGRMVKITLNPEDAYSALQVKQESPPGFVPVFMVYQLPETANPAFVILTQKVKPKIGRAHV